MSFGRFIYSLLTFATLIAPVAVFAGPISAYYLTYGDGQKVYMVQGNSLVNTINTNPATNHPYPIAVADTVRTFTYRGQVFGSEYQLDGTPTGNTYYNPEFLSLTDGTTDGVNFNYAIQWSTGAVYRYDRAWANGSVLFTVARDFGGITFDSMTGTLWVNNRVNGETRNYDLSGNLLSSFFANSNVGWSLAYEEASDSLWYWGDNDSRLYNYSKSGSLIESVAIAGVSGNILGGEFAITGRATVPVAGSLALIVLGLVGLGWHRRSS